MRLLPVLTAAFITGISAGGLPLLNVSGDRVVNDTGEEIFLRGMNMDLHYGWFHDDPDAPFRYATEEDAEYLSQLGCNCLRICLHWELFTTERGFELIDTYLSWCESRGIYLILDMHRVPPDNVTGGRAIWTSSEARDSLRSIWASIASRYAGSPGIAGYDLVNEPSAEDPEIWWELAQALADTIRVHDGDHILFVETPGGRCGGLRLIDDPNTVYSIHCYDPFTVSHAGASWPGDSRVPSNSSYPGDIVVGVSHLGWSSDAARWTEPISDWTLCSSGPLVIPGGVELASVKAFSSGDTGTVRFDDFSVSVNGDERTVLNADIEEMSTRRSGYPANWVFYPDGNFTGDVSEQGYRGGSCLRVNGSRGSASWIQTRAFYTEPLIKVSPGDTVTVAAMVLAPWNEGSISIGLDLLAERREYWNSDSLRSRISEALEWSRSNQVPLYVGEFGSLPGTGSESRNNLIADWVQVMNDEGLHWSYWAYRNLGDQGFGLMYDYSQPDEVLAGILSGGWLGD